MPTANRTQGAALTLLMAVRSPGRRISTMTAAVSPNTSASQGPAIRDGPISDVAAARVVTVTRPRRAALFTLPGSSGRPRP